MPVVECASRTDHGMWAVGIAGGGVATLVALKLFNPKLYDTLKWPIGLVTVAATGYDLTQLAQSRICRGGTPRGRLIRPEDLRQRDPLADVWDQNPTDFTNNLSEEQILEKFKLLSSSRDPSAQPFLEALAGATDAPHKLADVRPEIWLHVEESKRKACAGLVSTYSALEKVKFDLPQDPAELARCIEQVVSETQPERLYYSTLGLDYPNALVRALDAIKTHHPAALDQIRDSPSFKSAGCLPFVLRFDEQWGLKVAEETGKHELRQLAVDFVCDLYDKGDNTLKKHLAEAWNSRKDYLRLLETNPAFATAAAKQDPHLQILSVGEIGPVIKLYDAGDSDLRQNLAGFLGRRIDEVVKAGAVDFAVAIAKAGQAGDLSTPTAIQLYGRDTDLNQHLADRFAERVDELVEAGAMDFAGQAAIGYDAKYSTKSAIALYGGSTFLDQQLISAFKTRVDELMQANALDFAKAAAAQHGSVYSAKSAAALYRVGTQREKERLVRRCSVKVDALVKLGEIAFAVEPYKERRAECSVETAARLWKVEDDILRKKLFNSNKGRLEELVPVDCAFAVAVAAEASDQTLADLSDEATEKLGQADSALKKQLTSPTLILCTTKYLERIGMIPGDAKPSFNVSGVISERSKGKGGAKYVEVVWARLPHFVVHCLDMLPEQLRKTYVERALQKKRTAREWAEYLGTTCALARRTISQILGFLDIRVTKELLEAWPNDDLFEVLSPWKLQEEERAPYVHELVRRKAKADIAFLMAVEKKWDEALIIKLATRCDASQFKSTDGVKPYLQYMAKTVTDS